MIQFFAFKAYLYNVQLPIIVIEYFWFCLYSHLVNKFNHFSFSWNGAAKISYLFPVVYLFVCQSSAIPVYSNKSLKRDKERGLFSSDWLPRVASRALATLDVSWLGESCLQLSEGISTSRKLLFWITHFHSVTLAVFGLFFQITVL